MTLPYVTFNGVSSATALPNAVIEQLPAFQRARRQYVATAVSGRDGMLYGTAKEYEDYTVQMKVNVPKDDVTDAYAYFSGEGWMISSADDSLRYYVRFLDEINIVRHAAGDATLTIPMEVEPFARINPDAQDITITTSGTTITNPGTAYSLPRVTITGSGDFTVNIGSDSVHFESIPSGGIIVDSELLDAFNSSGTQLLNDLMDGEPWRIPTGTSLVSWDGNITRVVITPRWRCL